MPLSCFVLQTSSIRATFCRSPWVIVTNVVNPHDVSPENACFGLGLTTFVTEPRSDRLKMLRIDDVCNIGRPGRDRPHRRSRFRVACSEGSCSPRRRLQAGAQQYRMQFPSESFKLWQQILEIAAFSTIRRCRQSWNCMRLWVWVAALAYQWGRCLLHETEDTFVAS